MITASGEYEDENYLEVEKATKSLARLYFAALSHPAGIMQLPEVDRLVQANAKRARDIDHLLQTFFWDCFNSKLNALKGAWDSDGGEA